MEKRREGGQAERSLARFRHIDRGVADRRAQDIPATDLAATACEVETAVGRIVNLEEGSSRPRRPRRRRGGRPHHPRVLPMLTAKDMTARVERLAALTYALANEGVLLRAVKVFVPGSVARGCAHRTSLLSPRRSRGTDRSPGQRQAAWATRTVRREDGWAGA